MLTPEKLKHMLSYTMHFGRKNIRQHSPPFLPANEQQKCLQHKEIISDFFSFPHLRVEFPLFGEIPPTLE